MEKLVITGPTHLNGEVTISGAKNAAVAILPATLLIDGVCTIENLPNISDVKMSCKILEGLGAKITWITQNEIMIDTRNIDKTIASEELTRKFRASYYIIGSMLGRKGAVTVGMPGGCKLGARPIDQHIKGFEALGAKVDTTQGKITAKASKLVGTSIYMDVVSVGATINVMLASVLAEGTTIIDNAAKEPHIVDVANFLNTMGADIRGAGTDVIKINGVKKLTGNAKGKNWWCVMFPSLCFIDISSGIVDSEGKEKLENNLDSESYELISESKTSTEFKLKFKLLEVFSHNGLFTAKN